MEALAEARLEYMVSQRGPQRKLRGRAPALWPPASCTVSGGGVRRDVGCSLHPPSTSRADPVPAGPALTSVCRFMCSRRVNFFPQISQG